MMVATLEQKAAAGYPPADPLHAEMKCQGCGERDCGGTCHDNDNIVTNDQGGRQSKIAGRMTEVPPLALLAVSGVMGQGSVTYPREPDGTPNWHRIDSMSNIDHGLEHAARFCSMRNRPKCGDGVSCSKSMYEELSHHAARALMALEMFMKENPEAWSL